jgi:hypothetical protein
MPSDIETTRSPRSMSTAAERHYYRFHAPHLHLLSVFGDDWFALKAEAFARFLARRAFSSLRLSSLPFGFWSMSSGLQRSTSIHSSSSTSPSACKRHMRLRSYCWLRLAKPTATPLMPAPMRNIVRLCIPQARNVRRSRRIRRPSLWRCFGRILNSRKR